MHLAHDGVAAMAASCLQTLLSQSTTLGSYSSSHLQTFSTMEPSVWSRLRPVHPCAPSKPGPSGVPCQGAGAASRQPFAARWQKLLCHRTQHPQLPSDVRRNNVTSFDNNPSSFNDNPIYERHCFDNRLLYINAGQCSTVFLPAKCVFKTWRLPPRPPSQHPRPPLNNMSNR